MKLFTDDRSPERTRSFEGAGEGEVIGLDKLTAHVRKVEEGGDEMTIWTEPAMREVQVTTERLWVGVSWRMSWAELGRSSLEYILTR